MGKKKEYRKTEELSTEERASVLDKDFEALWVIQDDLTGDPVLSKKIKDIALFFYLQGIIRGAKFVAEGE